MKTLNELYTEVMNSEELKNEFLTLKAPEDIVAFAAKHGCTATLEEIGAFFEEKAQPTGELSEDDLAQVAGGKGVGLSEIYVSIGLIGVGCALQALASVANGRCGTAIKSSEGMLCVSEEMDEWQYAEEQARKNSGM